MDEDKDDYQHDLPFRERDHFSFYGKNALIVVLVIAGLAGARYGVDKLTEAGQQSPFTAAQGAELTAKVADLSKHIIEMTAMIARNQTAVAVIQERQTNQLELQKEQIGECKRRLSNMERRQ